MNKKAGYEYMGMALLLMGCISAANGHWNECFFCFLFAILLEIRVFGMQDPVKPGPVVWEKLSHDNGNTMYRSKVPGGWLVIAMDDVISPVNRGYPQPEYEVGYEWRHSVAFVPDPTHSWAFKEPLSKIKK